jgi:hypothetical protein
MHLATHQHLAVCKLLGVRWRWKLIGQNCWKKHNSLNAPDHTIPTYRLLTRLNVVADLPILTPWRGERSVLAKWGEGARAGSLRRWLNLQAFPKRQITHRKTVSWRDRPLPHQTHLRERTDVRAGSKMTHDELSTSNFCGREHHTRNNYRKVAIISPGLIKHFGPGFTRNLISPGLINGGKNLTIISQCAY